MMSPTQPFSYHIPVEQSNQVPVEQPNPVTEEKSNQIGVCDKIAESAKRSAAVGLALILFPVAKTIAITGSITSGGVNGILIPAYVIRWVIKSKNETKEGFWNKSFGKKFNFFKEVGRKPAHPFNRSFEYFAGIGLKNKQKVEKINAKIDSIIGSAGTGIGTAVGGGISLVGVAAVGAVSLLIFGIGQSIANPYSCQHHHHYHHHHHRSRC